LPNKLLKTGVLKILSFVPYAWIQPDKTGITFNLKMIKIVKEKHVGSATITNMNLDLPNVLSNLGENGDVIFHPSKD
jgi:hypothetical protein